VGVEDPPAVQRAARAGFEARAQHRQRLASLAIVAVWAKMAQSRSFLPSSPIVPTVGPGGLGAVNLVVQIHVRGSQTVSAHSRARVLLGKGSFPRFSRVSPTHFRKVLARHAFSPGFRGLARSTKVEVRNPRLGSFSSFSGYDGKSLLTGRSNTVALVGYLQRAIEPPCVQAREVVVWPSSLWPSRR